MCLKHFQICQIIDVLFKSFKNSVKVNMEFINHELNKNQPFLLIWLQSICSFSLMTIIQLYSGRQAMANYFKLRSTLGTNA